MVRPENLGKILDNFYVKSIIICVRCLIYIIVGVFFLLTLFIIYIINPEAFIISLISNTVFMYCLVSRPEVKINWKVIYNFIVNNKSKIIICLFINYLLFNTLFYLYDHYFIIEKGDLGSALACCFYVYKRLTILPAFLIISTLIQTIYYTIFKPSINNDCFIEIDNNRKSSILNISIGILFISCLGAVTGFYFLPITINTLTPLMANQINS